MLACHLPDIEQLLCSNKYAVTESVVNHVFLIVVLSALQLQARAPQGQSARELQLQSQSAHGGDGLPWMESLDQAQRQPSHCGCLLQVLCMRTAGVE